MDRFTTVGQNFWDSLNVMWQKVFETVPNILISMLIMLIGWLVARSLSFLVFKAIQLSKLEQFTSKAIGRDVSANTDNGVNLAQIVKKIVYWTVVLLFAVFASETLGWVVVTQELGNLLTYLPKLFSAVVIFIIGLYIAGFIRQAINTGINSLRLQASGVVSTAAYYLIMILVTITALNQAGIDTGAITTNFIVIIGSLFLAFALAFGLGAKDILGNMVASLYAKKTFHSGQVIKINGIEGTIEKIDSVNLILNTGERRVTMPVKKLVEETVEIISE